MTSIALETGRERSLPCFRKRAGYAFAQAHGMRQRLVSARALGHASRDAVARLMAAARRRAHCVSWSGRAAMPRRSIPARAADDRPALRACLWPDRAHGVRALRRRRSHRPGAERVDRARRTRRRLARRLAEPLGGRPRPSSVHSIVWHVPRRAGTGAAGRRCWREIASPGPTARRAGIARGSRHGDRLRHGSPERDLAEHPARAVAGSGSALVLGHAGYHGAPIRLDTLPA